MNLHSLSFKWKQSVKTEYIVLVIYLAFRFCNIFYINYLLFKTLLVFLRLILNLHTSVSYFFTTWVLEFLVTFYSTGILPCTV